MHDIPIDRALPPRFDGLLEEGDYSYLLDLCLHHLEGRADVHLVEKGLIRLGLGDIQDMQCALDNLVRQISSLPKASWRERVITHFGQLWLTLADHEENMKMLKDFEQVKSLLRLRVYPDSFGHADIRHKLVSRIDFPGTFTSLVLDYDNRFQLLTQELSSIWDITEEELFRIGMQNVNREKVEVNQIEVKNGPDVFAFLSSELSSSFILDFERNAHFAIGQHGSLVAIPAKNAAFCVPIDNGDFMPYLKLLSPLMLQFYEQGPGQITIDFYWYFEGKFYRFLSEEVEEGKMEYQMPEGLVQRLG